MTDAPHPWPGFYPPPTWRGADMMYVVKKLGLTGGLKLCLDAGDAASYTSGQSWLDRSGNGYDFFLGADGSATATDPAFNGTAGGRSASEYFSVDGGDYFRYDTTNETWMQNIHKDNANFTILLWTYTASLGAINGYAGTRGAAGNTGFAFFADGVQLNLSVQNAGSTVLLLQPTTLVPLVNQWNFMAVSLNEATGANGAVMQRNELQTLHTSTYSSPAAGNGTNTLEFGSRGGANSPLPSASRVAAVAAWEGASLSAPQLQSVFQATRGRFSI